MKAELRIVLLVVMVVGLAATPRPATECALAVQSETAVSGPRLLPTLAFTNHPISSPQSSCTRRATAI